MIFVSLIGMGLIIAGVAMLSVPCAFIVSGVLLTLLGAAPRGT